LSHRAFTLVLAALLRQRRLGTRVLPAVRQRQPLGQVAGGFVRRRSVERHHRRWKARGAGELGAPSVADGRDLDVVRTPANRFVESMNSHVCSMSGEVKRNEILRSRSRRSSEADREDSRTRDEGRVFRVSRSNFFSRVGFSTGFAPSVHRFSTTLSDGRAGRRRSRLKCSIG